MKNKYELVDLGKPKGRLLAVAYIVTPAKSLMIKGDEYSVCAELGRLVSKGIPYFGKMRSTTSKLTTTNRRPNERFVASGFSVKIINGKNRHYYELLDNRLGLGIAWTKPLRRLPQKWPKEIPVDPYFELVTAADFLEDHSFINPAMLLRKMAETLAVPRKGL